MPKITKRKPGENITLDTRADAHEKVDKAKRYNQIIGVLKKKDNLTAKEIAVILHKKGFIPTSERNFTAPRLTELSYKGIVEPVGKKECQYTGKSVAIYHLIDNSL